MTRQDKILAVSLDREVGPVAPANDLSDFPSPQPSRLAGSSVHAAIANEIGMRIVRGDYPPGSILPNEAKWAETFDVSRSAVREAIAGAGRPGR